MERVVTSYKNPDLDGVACMYAYSEYLNKIGIKSTYCVLGTPKKEVDIVCEMFNIRLNGKNNIDLNDEIVIVDNHDVTNFSNQNKIVEIIDHHTVYNGVTFDRNINVQIDVLGAAATLVTERFKNSNIDISRESAIFLYYGIISNSINLKSSVTDIRDIQACAYLKSKCSDIDDSKIEEIFIKKSQIDDNNLRKTLEAEHSIYLIGKNIIVGVLEIANVEEFLQKNQNKIEEIINEIENDHKPDIIFIDCIDILNGYSVILCNDSDSRKFLKDVLELNINGNTHRINKILLRKQIIRKLIQLDSKYVGHMK